MTRLPKIVNIIDDNGFIWNWDGDLLWVNGSENDDFEKQDYGYHCESLDEVFKVLVDGLYITFDG